MRFGIMDRKVCQDASGGDWGLDGQRKRRKEIDDGNFERF